MRAAIVDDGGSRWPVTARVVAILNPRSIIADGTRPEFSGRETAMVRMVALAAARQAALIMGAALGLVTPAAAQTTYTLTVGAETSYQGTSRVTSAPAGIDCRAEVVGDVGPTGTCTAAFPAGTLVTLT